MRLADLPNHRNGSGALTRGNARERAALAALLVEAARSNGEYDDGERARIDRVLATRFAVTEAEARALRAEGEEA